MLSPFQEIVATVEEIFRDRPPRLFKGSNLVRLAIVSRRKLWRHKDAIPELFTDLKHGRISS